MTKKSSVSYRRERLIKKSVHSISDTPTTVKKNLKKLATMPDSHIDYSEIPELDFDKLGKPLVGQFYRPIKKQISIRIDSDILDWF